MKKFIYTVLVYSSIDQAALNAYLIDKEEREEAARKYHTQGKQPTGMGGQKAIKRPKKPKPVTLEIVIDGYSPTLQDVAHATMQEFFKPQPVRRVQFLDKALIRRLFGRQPKNGVYNTEAVFLTVLEKDPEPPNFQDLLDRAVILSITPRDGARVFWRITRDGARV